MTKRTMKDRAVALRKQGYSYNLILESIPVSKSTLSLWLADIPYSPNSLVQNRVRGAALAVSNWSNQRKRKSLQAAKQAALKKIGTISERDIFMLGIGLYIGEGAKSSQQVRIINSDPQVINLAITWFENSFGLSKDHFSPTIHLYPDNNVDEAIAFWSRVTGIPISQFGKTQIDRRKKGEKKRGMLKYGTAHLHVRSKGEERFGRFLFREIIASMDEIFRHTN